MLKQIHGYNQLPSYLLKDGSILDISNLNNKLIREDYESIINSRQLFFEKYLTIYAKQVPDYDCFVANASGNEIRVTGRNHILSAVQNMVELFRQLAWEALENKAGIKRILIPVTDRFYLRKPSEKRIDLTDWLSDNVKDKLDKHWFEKYIKLNLFDLFEELGFRYSEGKAQQEVEILDERTECLRVIAIQIAPKQEEYHVYPILPAIIPPAQHPPIEFYAYYKEQKFCDYTLISSEGMKFPIQGIIFSLYGGHCFKTLLSSCMDENGKKEKKIPFSTEVLECFIDYVYLGPQSLEKKLFDGKVVDLFGLLELSHLYQIPALFEKTVNLLILFAGPQDYEAIEYHAKLYKDEDLSRLADYLNPAIQKIKV